MSSIRSRLASLPNFVTTLSSVVISSALSLLANPAAAQYYGRMPSYPMQDMTPHGWKLYATRILTYVLTVAIGFGIGAFFSPKLAKFRRALWLGVAGLAFLFTLVGPYPAADYLGYFACFILFGIALSYGRALGKRIAAKIRRMATSYGSAQWATYKQLEDNGLLESGGYVVGEIAAPNGRFKRLTYKGDRHLLTVAPTRSGKGVSTTVPNQLTYSGSMLSIEPKADNVLMTAYRRGAGSTKHNIKGMGQEVYLFDPWDIAASKLGLKQACFNPLDWITTDDPDAAENSHLLADAIVLPAEGGSEARFWREQSKALSAGVIHFVATHPSEKGQRDLGRVADILSMNEYNFKTMLQKMYEHPEKLVSNMAARMSMMDEKLFSNVLTSAQSHFHFLDSPRVRESLSRSDFRFEDLKRKPMTVMVCIPADRVLTYDRLTRLLVQQAITVNARNIEEKPEKPVLFMLDEMATLGRLPAIEQAYGLMAGFGMQLWGIVQDLSQLARIYGEESWQTFISNSGVIQYFGSRDLKTAEYFSSLCGVTTIEVHNFSWAVGRAVSYATSFSSGSGGGSSSSSTTYGSNWTRTSGTSEAQRKLAYPDELMVMKADQEIVFIENHNPIAARKVVWHTDAELKQHGIDLHKVSFKAPVTITKVATLMSPADEVTAAPSNDVDIEVSTTETEATITCESCGKSWTVEIGKHYTCECQAPLTLKAS